MTTIENAISYDLGPHITAFSTTRRGGVGTGAYATFNVTPYCGDTPEHVCQNLETLCQKLDIDRDKLLLPHQTHGTRVISIDTAFLAMTTEEREETLEGVDALTTDLPGVCIGVSTADCIPILIADTARHAVCAVHAGWRGTVGRIAEKAVRKMTETYGSCPSKLKAQIGPGISLESFEVGQEVYDAFEAAHFDMSTISRRFPSTKEDGTKKWHIDLPTCNRLQLLRAGLKPETVAMSNICTFRCHDTFFSARRLGINSGRIFSGIIYRPSDTSLFPA